MDIKEIQTKQNDEKSRLQGEIKRGLADLKTPDNYDEPRGFQGPGVIYGDEPPKLKESEYLRSALGWTYAAVSAIADAVMKLQLRLYKTDANGDITEVTNHKALDLLYRVNRFQTFPDFIWLTQQYLELAGEAPWFIDRGDSGKSDPQNILLLQPDRLFVKKADSKSSLSPISGYDYKLNGTNQIAITNDELIFLKYPDPINPWRGKGTLQAAARTYDIENYSEEYNRRFFFNGGRPDSLITTTSKLNDKQRRTIQADIKRMYQGVKNSQKIAILEDGLDWKPMALTGKEMEFIEQMKFSRDKLLAIFRVPKSIVSVTEDVNLANAKVGEYVFAKWTIKPKLMRLVAQLNEFYLPMFSGTQNMFLSFDDPVPSDIELDIKRYDSALGKGYMTVNEVRAELNLEDVGPEGDVLLVPSSAVPLDMAGQMPQLPAPIRGVKANNAKMGIIERSAGGFYKAQRIAKAVNSAKKTVEKFGKNIEKIAKAEVSKMIANRKQREKIKRKEWENQIKQFSVEFRRFSDRYELLFIKATRLIFNEQLKKILKKFPRAKMKKVNIDDYMLDPEDEAQMMVRVYNPMIEKIIAESGGRAARLVGRQAFDMATRAVQTYLSKRAYEFSFEMNEETNNLLGKSLADGIAAGDGIPELKARVSLLFQDMEKYRSERIARSEVIRASNFSTTEAYKQSGVVSKVQWLATDDDKICEFCAPQDMKVIDLGDNFYEDGDSVHGRDGGSLNLNYGDVEFPPLHPNCRCTTVPIIN